MSPAPLRARTALALLLVLVPWAPPAGGEPNATAAALDVAQVDALPVGPSVAERLAVIQRRIQEALVYPVLAQRRGLAGVTHVRFEIDAEGRAARVETARSSGSALLDRAAERSARRAGPLPHVYGRLEVPIRFRLEDTLANPSSGTRHGPQPR